MASGSQRSTSMAGCRATWSLPGTESITARFVPARAYQVALIGGLVLLVLLTVGACLATKRGAPRPLQPARIGRPVGWALVVVAAVLLGGWTGFVAAGVALGRSDSRSACWLGEDRPGVRHRRGMDRRGALRRRCPGCLAAGRCEHLSPAMDGSALRPCGRLVPGHRGDRAAGAATEPAAGRGRDLSIQATRTLTATVMTNT